MDPKWTPKWLQNGAKIGPYILASAEALQDFWKSRPRQSRSVDFGEIL